MSQHFCRSRFQLNFINTAEHVVLDEEYRIKGLGVLLKDVVVVVVVVGRLCLFVCLLALLLRSTAPKLDGNEDI